MCIRDSSSTSLPICFIAFIIFVHSLVILLPVGVCSRNCVSLYWYKLLILSSCIVNSLIVTLLQNSKKLISHFCCRRTESESYVNQEFKDVLQCGLFRGLIAYRNGLLEYGIAMARLTAPRPLERQWICKNTEGFSAGRDPADIF